MTETGVSPPRLKMTSEALNVSHEFWEVNGIRMHVAVAGQGPPIVLLHGFPEFWWSWRYLIPRLASQFRVIAPDTRGVGETEIPESGYDLDSLARDAAGLIDRVGGSAILVGHDWGGVIGWHTAASYPDKVKAFISAAGPHPARYLELLFKSPRQFLMSLYTLYFQIPLIPEWTLSAGRGWILAQLLKMSARRRGAFTPSDLDRYRELWSNRARLGAGINYYRMMGRSPLATLRFYRERKLKCPVSVVFGSRDWFLSMAQTKTLERFCESGPRVRLIPECGHWLPQEAPLDLFEAILETAGMNHG